jgi:hypothetical protein
MPLAAVVLALLALLAAGCGGEDERPAGSGGGGDEPAGRFVLRFDEPSDEDAAYATDVIREHASLRELVDGLNASIALPRRVTVRVGGSDGPYYDPERREIVMSPDFVDHVGTLFAEDDPSMDEDELLEQVGAVVDYVFLHETGHALVDQLDLPVTGREEDAVDELATVVSTQLVENGADMALAAAYMFALFGEERETIDEAEFWGEHALDEQRFYTILCHVYGSDPDAFASLAEESGIDDERLEQCPAEYEQKVEAWETLLEPHLRE